ncbi:MAG: acyl-CoA synthetase [Rhodobacteraceae bacterium]|nr:acyl-CoA synthetase [Paracoccaceae bacterium]
MRIVATHDDKVAIERETPWESVEKPTTIYQMLSQTRDRHGDRNALSFQLLADPQSDSETLTWNELHGKVTQAANLFRSLGVGKDDTVAYLMPNATETAIALFGGMVAGKVSPINPLLSAEQIAGILRSSNARVLVTLRSFPKTNIAQLSAAAVAMAPGVSHVLEVDLARYLKPPKSWLVSILRPKNQPARKVATSSFNAALDRQSADRLDFDDVMQDRVVSLFHTGGTTGLPKLVQHQQSGIIYNAKCSDAVGITEEDNVFCPLPMFHAFAAYAILATSMAKGSHVVFPTPAGYRGEGVFDNFWKLLERWKITFVATVPTALSVLMQRPVDADLSALKTAFCGSAPLPKELFEKFERATDVDIIEGYGLTEATCLVSVNPLKGRKKIGSVGFPFPYCDVRILERDAEGQGFSDCGKNQTGEICVANPGVYVGNTYTADDKNQGLFVQDRWLRTGDLGMIDDEDYLWITGRIKDLIIRGGHNIDPAIIEEAMAGHPEVAFVGVIGQPDSRLGELPCAYLELIEGATASLEDLRAFADKHITDRLASPAYLEVLEELPKTAVGKVFKPDLRKMAIDRVLQARFDEEGINSSVSTIEEARRGLVVLVGSVGDPQQKVRIKDIMGEYALAWEWCA